MKMNKDIFRLKHILQSIERIEIISEGISFEIFTTEMKFVAYETLSLTNIST